MLSFNESKIVSQTQEVPIFLTSDNNIESYNIGFACSSPTNNKRCGDINVKQHTRRRSGETIINQSTTTHSACSSPTNNKRCSDINVKQHTSRRSGETIINQSTTTRSKSSLMDPASFKLILKQQSEEIATYKRNRPERIDDLRSKHEWSTFLTKARKNSRRAKRRTMFVWERKQKDASRSRYNYIESVHDLTKPM